MYAHIQHKQKPDANGSGSELVQPDIDTFSLETLSSCISPRVWRVGMAWLQQLQQGRGSWGFKAERRPELEACCQCYRVVALGVCDLRTDIEGMLLPEAFIGLGQNPNRAIFWWSLLVRSRINGGPEEWCGLRCEKCNQERGAPVHWARTDTLERFWRKQYRWVKRQTKFGMIPQ